MHRYTEWSGEKIKPPTRFVTYKYANLDRFSQLSADALNSKFAKYYTRIAC